MARLAETSGEAVVLIVIDTMARAVAGDDENSASDAAAFLEKRVAEIQRQTGAAVMVVHHSGKEVSRGMRGSNAVFAAADLVMCVDAHKSVTAEKVKDGHDGHLCSFVLAPCVLGQDEDSDNITSCTVEISAAATAAARQPALAPQPKKAWDMLLRLFNDGKGKVVQAHEIDLQGRAPHLIPKVIELEQWRDKCRTAGLTAEGKDAAERKAFKRAVEALEKANRVCRYRGFVWILDRGTSGQAGTSRDMSHLVQAGQDRTPPYRVSCMSGCPDAGNTDGEGEVSQ